MKQARTVLRIVALSLAAAAAIVAVVAYWDKISCGAGRLGTKLRTLKESCPCCRGEYDDYEDLEL